MTRLAARLPFTEVSRKHQQFSDIDAVLIRRHAHSTVSDPYELYLVPHRSPVSDEMEPVFRADHVNEIRVSWTGPKEVTILSGQARFFVKESRVVREFAGRPLGVRVLYPEIP